MSYSRKIKEVRLENFKGYRVTEGAKAKAFDLDADLVLVTGKNGVGKTSLLEALDWVLNHKGESAGKFLNTKSDYGSVIVDGDNYNIEGKGIFDQKSLKTVSTFFYQENIDRLACDEVVGLLEPKNQSASELKNGLKNLQSTLEDWQRKIYGLKHRKNYDEERKNFSGQINEMASELPEDSKVRETLMGSTLTLKNGNLQSRWESQIRNLSEALGVLSNIKQPVGSKLVEQLNHISTCLRVYDEKSSESSDRDVESILVDKDFISRVSDLPDDLEVWLIGDQSDVKKDDKSSVLYVSSENDVYSDELVRLKDYQERLRSEYRKLTDLVGSLDEDEGSLRNWIKTFEESVDDWIRAWDDHADKGEAIKIKKSISGEVFTLKEISSLRLKELRDRLLSVENEGGVVSSSIRRLLLFREISNAVVAMLEKFKHIFREGKCSGRELKDSILAIWGSPDDRSEKLKQSSVKDSLAMIFEKWAALEKDREFDENNVTSPERLDNSEKLIADAYAICKQESSSRSQLLSLVGTIPQEELDNLVKNMNVLLGSFHFPDEFLPISIENIGTTTKPVWGFKTKGNVNFQDLSTGQKSQLAICWTINLNLALHEDLGHQVIGFDDFTTSLDMNQLIPASVLLRKLAYADENDSWKRQVIVTSHHEDLTNRLLDFLLPPKGKTMKVIQFEDWSSQTGPVFQCYEVDMGVVALDGIEHAIERAVIRDGY